MAFSWYKLRKWTNAKNCCQNVKKQAAKYKTGDAELEAATTEIWNSAVKESGSQAYDSDEGDSGSDDEGWVSDSSDDVAMN